MKKTNSKDNNVITPLKRPPGRSPKGKTWDPLIGCFVSMDDNCSEYIPSIFDDDTISNHD